jgi:hypothetical protein
VTGGDRRSKLVMKGSPVRVRASASRDLPEFCLRAGREYKTGTRASRRVSCAPDLVLRRARLGAFELFKEMGIRREGHRRHVARLACDLDDRGSLQRTAVARGRVNSL